MITKDQVAKHVRVKFTKDFEPSSISQENLMTENVIYIRDKQISNDSTGEYVWVRGISKLNSAPVYLSELELEFPIED